MRRKSFIPLLIISGLVVLLLFFNDETSVTLNMEYDVEINRLQEEIALSRDSAEYFRTQREAILNQNSDVERIAREKFHMHRPTEDLYILN